MLTFAEFFAGGGMARLGFGAGWRCTFANDIDHASLHWRSLMVPSVVS